MPIEGDKLKDLLLLYKNIEHQYNISSFTNNTLKQIQRSINIARVKLLNQLDMMDFKIIEGRETDLLRELNKMTFGIQSQLTGDIVTAYAETGTASYKEYGNILSFDGALKDTVGFNYVSVSPAQLRAMAVDVPVGGKLLKDWVSDTFEGRIVSDIKDVIVAENLAGVSTPKIIDIMTDKFDMIQQDAETLVRTHLAQVNNDAAKAVYDANKDIVKEVEWSATLEVRHSGRGTCLQCSVLDGRVWKIDEPHPSPPIHHRCRCFLLPKTASYKELGLNIPEMKRSLRPYTERADKRKIIKAGQFQGQFEDFLKTRDKKYQIDLLGHTRYGFWKSGKIKFDDLVEKKGNIRLLKRNKDGEYIGLQ